MTPLQLRARTYQLLQHHPEVGAHNASPGCLVRSGKGVPQLAQLLWREHVRLCARAARVRHRSARARPGRQRTMTAGVRARVARARRAAATASLNTALESSSPSCTHRVSRGAHA